MAVVDDDAVTRETLKAYLEDEGIAVHAAGNAEDLEALLARQPVDIILLDIRLPGKDGLTVTRELRVASAVGIILLTSRGDRLDRIVGLEMGADDYIVKPFEPREVLARTRNLLRRVRGTAAARQDRRRSFAGWTLYLDRRRLVGPDGTDVRLTGAEFELLSVFASNPGRIMTRDYLLEATTRRRSDAADRTIDSLVRRLRRLLEDDAGSPRLIVTVHGSGYVFATDVT
ncbi:response regulator [Azospirillum sp. ST 5-10]|uniref:response regulator n=1 Tax=unclassified Azospirillum TaxID=2630922 RepID=UPI003F49BBCB